jgi:rhodanese-related sulfurtransferase
VVRQITPLQAQELIANAHLDIVDVREPSEWSTGRLPGARLVPLGELRAHPKESLPRDGIIFVCAAGVRSETAARVALQNGCTQVYNLGGGTRSWTKAGFPLVQD